MRSRWPSARYRTAGASRIAYAQGATDPTVVKARAAINRGEYAEAEALLKPLATRTPDGEAALELGLFYEMMGRRDESLALLRRISNIQVGPRTSPAEYARLGRAARALGEFQLANDAYRIATEKAPNDPSLHTGWGELFLHVHNNAEAAKSFQDALATRREVDSRARRNGAGAHRRESAWR